MKKLFMAISAIGFSLVSFPHTESEMLDVARRMVHIVDLGTSYDHIDAMLANYREWSRPEVFFGINIDGWTVDEKKEAFDAYIRYIATNDSERLLILGVGTHYTEDFYLGFVDVLCDMRTNNAITVRELHDAMASHRADIDSCLARRYQETNVVALLNKLKIADGDSAGWDYYLSGMAYTNYIDMAGSGSVP